MLLVKRSKKEGVEVAKAMNINQSYLSKLYNQPGLTIKVRRAAAQALGVNIEIFEHGLGYAMPPESSDRVGDGTGLEYETLAAEVERLKAENAKMAEELLRERGLSDDLRAALRLVAGKASE